ncbi:MAG: fructose-1,6-bisphosphatase [Bacillota bacterium]
MDYKHKYLELLSKEFPTVQAASTEFINLNAIINLPKGTEHFITDIHGEYDAFNHFLKNASGIIKQKIDQHLTHLSETQRNRLAFFIYYPTDMLHKYQQKLSDARFKDLLKAILKDMVALSRVLARKYTKSHVRKTLPKEFSYIIQELLYETGNDEDKARYYKAIIQAIFETEREHKFILQISRFIRNLAIDRLHVVGDIFDRGPKPHLVMEKIAKMKHIDIEWGNHDIIWMGAASGSMVCVANVIRIAARYNNLDYLEDGYGINLLPLARFASKTYIDDPCTRFQPITDKTYPNNEDDTSFVAKIHKAISIIQFKVERDVILRNPQFNLQDRLLLDKINIHDKTITINHETYPLNDTHFPTINFNDDPFKLTQEERDIIAHLTHLFKHNEMLQKHVKVLFQKGAIYKRYNNNLLFHAAIPLNEDGSFMTQIIDGKPTSGKSLFEAYEQQIRHAYYNRYEKNINAKDYFLMLWQGQTSPLFAKDKMTTFERYFIADKTTHKEHKNPYFTLRTRDDVLDKIYDEFSLNKTHSKIINGHIPMDITQGADVISKNKKVYTIDGGMSKQYKNKTSIGGYTLISDSYAFYLVSHERFSSYIKLIQEERDIVSITHDENINTRRTYIYDTDKGKTLKTQINDLATLINAYRDGLIKEQS